MRKRLHHVVHDLVTPVELSGRQKSLYGTFVKVVSVDGI